MDQTIETPNTESPAAETPATETDPAISSRIRTSLALAQTRITAVPARAKAQWEELPGQLREALDRVLTGTRDRLRSALDLPSRDELASLLARVEELDRRLANLQAAEAEVVEPKRKTRSKNGASKSTKSSSKTLDKSARREAIRAAAGGGAKKKSRKG